MILVQSPSYLNIQACCVEFGTLMIMSGSTNYDMQGHKRLRLEFDYGDAAYSDCIHAPPDTSKFWHESSVNVFEINDSHAGKPRNVNGTGADGLIRQDYLANLDDAAFMKHLQVLYSTSEDRLATFMNASLIGISILAGTLRHPWPWTVPPTRAYGRVSSK